MIPPKNIVMVFVLLTLANGEFYFIRIILPTKLVAVCNL